MPAVPSSPVLLRGFRLAAVALLATLGFAARADIVIGQVAPFTGPQAVTGQAIHAGAKLYLDSVNAAGGVRGQKVKLVTRDDAQKPEDTVRLVKELIVAESPVAMIGTVGTANLEALAKDGVLAKARMPMVGAVSGAASVARAEGMFVVKARYHDEVDRLFENLTNLGLNRVGLVYQDDGLGQDVLAGANAAAQRRTVTLVDTASYARNTTDTSAAVTRMLAAKPQAIFLGATTAAAIDFVTRYRAAGGTAQLYGMSIIDPDLMLKKIGAIAARGYAFTTVLPLPADNKRAVVREYLALSAESKDPNLSTRSLEGFIAAKAVVAALKRAARLAPDAISEALSAPEGMDVGNFPLNFSQKGRTGSAYVDFAMLGSDGKLVR
ncbi:ABC transporter substrate-binding protein [Ideonella azotifigens]|uniref:Leucine-binding protein domain-containing protein n=1 Tax=Ideonella azotifigens TaxID=513160 RepID=A0ABP3VK39_9BURK|nr:ABC transporter substrate-binding protein [Ideonella azotifigens]MCD2338937.1 ABC transporter substrate-binding protein [Ideonella azotifigens]